MKNRKLSVIFPISLIGLPIICLGLLVSFGFNGSVDDSKTIFITTMSSVFILMVFAVTGVIFSFYTLISFWSKCTNFEKLKYTLVSLLANVLAPYVLSKIWFSEGINPYSFKEKTFIDMLSIFFYFCIFIAISLPVFIATRNV